jgi:carbon-monoxide dehydrogenase small subunit
MNMPSTLVPFTLNGREIEVIARPMFTLQQVIREQLGYMATNSGCRQGGCGSCTVLLDGEPVVSCLLPVADIAGRRVTTLEGLATGDSLHPLQEVFFDHFGVQCGYCSPGMIMVAKALLDQNPRPSREEIAEAIAGNVCRCTGYLPIIEAIELAAGRLTRTGRAASLDGDNGGAYA